MAADSTDDLYNDEENPLSHPLPEMLERTAEIIAKTSDLSADQAQEMVDEKAERYADATNERFVPTLVERDVRHEARSAQPTQEAAGEPGSTEGR